MADLVKVVIRLAALFMIISGVRHIMPYVGNLKDSGELASLVDRIGFASQSLTIAIGVSLLMYPAFLGVAGQPDRSEPEGERYWLSSVLIAILGLYFLTQGLIDAGYYFMFSLFHQSTEAMTSYPVPYPPELVSGVISTALELIVGVLLIVGPGKLSVMLRRIRQI